MRKLSPKELKKELKPYKIKWVKPGTLKNSPSMQKKYDDGLKLLQSAHYPEELREKMFGK